MHDARLVHKADFDRVFAESQRARTAYLMVMVRPNSAGLPRLGMIVAKRLLRRAVDRNRVKRCIRESFRQVLPELPACDFVVRLLVKPLPGDEARDLPRTFQRAAQRAMAKWPAAKWPAAKWPTAERPAAERPSTQSPGAEESPPEDCPAPEHAASDGDPAPTPVAPPLRPL